MIEVKPLPEVQGLPMEFMADDHAEDGAFLVLVEDTLVGGGQVKVDPAAEALIMTECWATTDLQIEHWASVPSDRKQVEWVTLTTLHAVRAMIERCTHVGKVRVREEQLRAEGMARAVSVIFEKAMGAAGGSFIRVQPKEPADEPDGDRKADPDPDGG